MDLEHVLRTRLDDELAGVPTGAARAGVRRLVEAYRSGRPPARFVLGDRLDALVYAAYRMPATHAAAAAVFDAMAEAMPSFAPATLLDLGGGTGAALWASSRCWPSLAACTVVDGSRAALDVGADLAAASEQPALTASSWIHDRLPAAVPAHLPTRGVDLVTIAYVLGELPETERDHLIASAARTSTVVVIEPGTPAGYRRVLRARQQLLDAGLTVMAPCPVQTCCPLEDPDWCHFSVRVARSALHRRLKDADLGHEDEKYAYVAATRIPVLPPARPRILRRPEQRKGLVTLRLCTEAGLETRQVRKRDATGYREARRAAWGDSLEG